MATTKTANVNFRTDADLRDAFYRSCQGRALVPAHWLRLQMREFVLSFGTPEDRLLIDPDSIDYRTRSV